jgi:hypothetical protein
VIPLPHSLEVLLDPLIRIRIEFLYSNHIKSNSTYVQLVDERDQYFKKIQDSLPESTMDTVFLYEDTEISIQAILEREIYLQGFKDALCLLNESNIILR